MHKVTDVDFGCACRTQLWLSEKAIREIAHFKAKGDPNNTYWKTLERCCKNGFALYTRNVPPNVVFEWDGVFRFGTRRSLFRIYGFFPHSDWREFVAIDALLKRGQKLDVAERKVIDSVAEVKRSGLWKKEER